MNLHSKPSVEKRRHSYSFSLTGEWGGWASDAAILVSWLNDPSSDEWDNPIDRGLMKERRTKNSFEQQQIVAAKRIGSLLERLQELSRVNAAFRAGKLPYRYVDECCLAVSEITNQYKIIQGYCLLDDGGIGVGDIWVNSFSTLTEYAAHNSIRGLVKRKSLDRIVKCTQCRVRWIVRWRKDRQFCSADCRQKYYEASPGGKAARRRANRRSYLKRISSIRKDRGKKRAKS